MPEQSGDRRRGNLVAVAGPSGVGKSTVVREVVKRDPSIWLSVSATTRGPRPTEQDGIDYLFVSVAEFEAMRRSGGLLESAEYSGHLYGTPRAPMEAQLAAGRPVLLEIEVQGVRQITSAIPECSTVFIAPPSWQILQERLTARGTEDAVALAQRLATAKQELLSIDEFDTVIINADIERACMELLAWIENPKKNPQR